MRPSHDPAVLVRIQDALARHHGNKSAVARELGCSRNTVLRYAMVAEDDPVLVDQVPPADRVPAVVPPDRQPEWSRNTKENGTSEVVFWTLKKIRSKDEVAAEAGIDLSREYIASWECQLWTNPMRARQGVDPVTKLPLPDRPMIMEQYRTKVTVKPIASSGVLDGIDRLYARFQSHNPYQQLPAVRTRSRDDDHLAVFGLFDVHFGKLAWAPETGSESNLKKTDRVFRNAVEDLIEENRHVKVSRILFPIGNDAFHIDSSKNTTTSGTPMDVSGRYPQIVEACQMAYVWAFERLAQEAFVEAIPVKGNHDEETVYHTARFLHAWFRSHPNIKVGTSPASRQYHNWGVNLLGFTHGKEEKRDALPGLMANEEAEAWATSKCRHWFTGHNHQASKYVTRPLETRQSVQIHTLRSLSGTDEWHYRNGYLNLDQAGEVFWYHRTRGYRGHAVAPADYR